MRDAASEACETGLSTRPGFPVCTVVGTIGLLILVLVTLVRDHHQTATAERAMSQPVATAKQDAN